MKPTAKLLKPFTNCLFSELDISGLILFRTQLAWSMQISFGDFNHLSTNLVAWKALGCVHTSRTKQNIEQFSEFYPCSKSTRSVLLVKTDV